MPTPAKHTCTVLLITASFLLSGCSLLGDSDDPLVRLRQHEQIWSERNISNYRYNLTIACFCSLAGFTPATVVVQADTVHAVLNPETGDPIRHPGTDAPLSDDLLAEIPTIDGLFDVIYRAIENEADELTVEYHASFGFPRTIDIDYIEEAVDDEIGYRAEALRPALTTIP